MKSILATSLLLSAALTPAIASASTPASDAATAQPVRISTGVTAPELLKPISLNVPSALDWEPLPNDGQVAVSLVVDENGNAHDAQVTKSLSRFWDARVLAAVESAKYRPASIDNKSIPMTVNLLVKIAR
ncbi:MAG: TonB family protein [Terracidiphilus sp.]|nr:TonB family protein [Terracidiphilus sp.]